MSRAQIFILVGALAWTTVEARGQSDSSAVSTPSVSSEQGIPFPPRGKDHAQPVQNGTRLPSTKNAMTTVVGGLAVCLGSFFLFVWVTKRHAPAGMARLPAEVLESLGRAPLSGRQHLQLLRVGRKLVLLNITPSGTTSLTEITDPTEVDRLVGLCQQSKPNSVSASFREVLTQYESEKTSKGFLGAATQNDWEVATRGSRQPANRREVVDD